jgi:hypothetical protein
VRITSSSEPSKKWGREEKDDDESHRRRLIKEGTPLAPEEPEEVLPPLPDKPEEVLPPLSDKPEEVPPPPPDQPEVALTLQPMADVRDPPLNADEATWSVSLFSETFVKLRKVAVHLGIPKPNDPLQRTMMDYAFKIHILVVDLERGVLVPVDDGSLDGSGTGSGSGSDSDSDGGAPPAVTTFA